MSSSYVISTEEDTTETFSSDLQLQPKTRTLESMPESSVYSNKLEFKMEASIPVFTKQLSSLDVRIGDAVKLSVIVSGFPKPSIHWWHNREELSTSEVYTFLYDGHEYSCLIPCVEESNEGEYTCIAINEHGQTICSSYITVIKRESIDISKHLETSLTLGGQSKDNKQLLAPTFVKPLQSVCCTQNDKAVLEYKVTGNPKPKVRWFRDNKQILAGKRHTICIKQDGIGFLTIHKCQQEDSGLYTCKAFNSLGKTSCTAELKVVSNSSIAEKESKMKVTKSYKKSSVQESTETRLYAVKLPGESEQEHSDTLYTIGTEAKYSAHSEEGDSLQEVINLEQQLVQLEPQPNESIPLAISVITELVDVSEQNVRKIVSPVFQELVPESQSLNVPVTEEITLEDKEREVTDNYPCGLQLGLTHEKKTRPVSFITEEKQLISCDTTASISLKETIAAVSTPGTKDVLHTHNVEIVEESTKEQLLGEEAQHLLEMEKQNLASKSDMVLLEHMATPVIDTKHILLREQNFNFEKAKEEKAMLIKDHSMKSGLMLEEKHQFLCEHALSIQDRDDEEVAKYDRELKQVMHLQVVEPHTHLPSEENIFSTMPSEDQADITKSPVFLLSSLYDDRHTILCEDTGNIKGFSAEVNLNYSKEPPPILNMQTLQSDFLLPKEEEIIFIKTDLNTALNKMEKFYKRSLHVEDKHIISGESIKELQITPQGVEPMLVIERQQHKCAVTMKDVILLPKEELVATEKEQRAVVQKDDFQPVIKLCTTIESRAIVEGHADFVPDIDINTCQITKALTRPVEITCIENHGIPIQIVIPSDAARIQEGQSVSLPLAVEEKQAIPEEHLNISERSGPEILKVKTQLKELLSSHDVIDPAILHKEQLIASEDLRSFNLEIKGHVRRALYSALINKSDLLSAEILKNIQNIDVKSIKVTKEPKNTLCTYVITTSNFSIEEVTLSLPRVYPQSIDLKTELKAAFQAVIFEERHILEASGPESIITRQEKALIAIEQQQEMSKATIADKPNFPDAYNSVNVKTESEAFQPSIANQATSAVMTHMEIKDIGAAACTDEVTFSAVSIQEQVQIVKKRETREEIYEDELLKESSTPIIRQCLLDYMANEGDCVTFNTVINSAKTVNWYFNDRLLSSGIEFKCSQHNDTYILVISKVQVDIHQGDYTCEALNDAGKSTTSAQLTVVKRGWIMGIVMYHFSANNTIMQCFNAREGNT